MNIIKKFQPEIYIFFSYIIFYYFTFKFLFPFQSKILGSESMLVGVLLFLPHGVRVISTVVYGLRSLIPLLFAHFLTILGHIDTIGYNLTIVLTFISSFCIFLELKLF